MSKQSLLFLIIGIAVVFIVLLIILVIVILNVIGLIGIKSKSSIRVNSGMDINHSDRTTDTLDLNGFGDNLYGTVLISGQQSNDKTIRVSLISCNTGRKYEGLFKSAITVGKMNIGKQIDFLLIDEDPTISKNHLNIFIYENDIYIQDMGSTNHTWINGKIISNIQKVNSGDIVRMGNSEFKLIIK